MRILIAAILGGLTFFIWSAIAHMATPLGAAGMSVLPEEERVLTTLRETVPQSGMYFYPGADMKNLTEEQQKEWEARIKKGPTGLLIITTGGGEAMSPRQLGSELVVNILAAGVAAFLVSLMAAPFLTRVLAVALLGVFAFLATSASYWIWYNFPTAFVSAELITEVVGWLLAGLVIAKIVPSRLAEAR